MSYKFLDYNGLLYFWGKLKAYFQPLLISGTNIKTINNESLLGSGNISIQVGTETDPVFTASAAHGISTSDITNWNGKQVALVSGTNIKTINNTSLLGSGNISIQSGINDAFSMILPSDGDILTASGSDILNLSGDGDITVIGDENNQEVTIGISATSTPIANKISKYDSSAHMNSTDMTAAEVTSFVNGLNVTGIQAVDYIIEEGTEGIWTYRKWQSGQYDAWCDGFVYNVAVQTAVGAMYTNDDPIRVDCPSFHDPDSRYTISVVANGADFVAGSGFTNTYATFKIYRATSRAAAARSMKIYLHGTWTEDNNE